LTFFVFGMVSIVISRVATPVFLARAKSSGAFARDCILVGSRGNAMLASLAELLHQGAGIYPSIVTFDPNCEGEKWRAERKAMLASIMQLGKSRRTGEIYVAASDIPADRLDGILRSLSLLPRPVLVLPDSSTASLLRHRVTAVGEAVAVEVQKEPLNAAQRTIKRALDIGLASAALVVLGPFLALVAVAVKLDSPGPVIFRQLRYGYNSRPFKILKFRTMTVLEDGDTVTQARQHDPRITRVGRWLRRNSIDELPQLINVIRGEMSLVGPRPHARAHDELYANTVENYEVRQQVKPGITGWAQVNGLRGETADVSLMYRRIEYDLWYAKHCGLLLDFQILVRTIFVVAPGRGAY
jgi:undecaprenyl-phosphate galactose phosphotransferase/putative colanic acid biosynthesis UDP-glucose lipid carrier transferase